MNSAAIQLKKLREEIIEGLSSGSKYLPSKLFYDNKGSKLFDQICELKEYYLTRTELKIMQDNIKSITQLLKNYDAMIELGSGNSSKTRILLNSLPSLKYYIPVDISSKHLLKSAEELKNQYPALNIIPVIADYTKKLDIPLQDNQYLEKVIYFPGSTIGNFTRDEAREFLEQIRKMGLPDGSLLIGVDLVKDREILTRAYNDKEGVTARFNLNILSHVNKITGSEINISCFRHEAVFNESESRIEMYLVSVGDQKIKIGGTAIHFKTDERILTEYSYKYTIDSFRELTEGIFKLRRIWTDKDQFFSVFLLDII